MNNKKQKVETSTEAAIDGNTVLPAVLPFTELSEEQQQPFIDMAIKVLSGLHCCTRVWEAWQVGTMTQDDFVEAAYDDDLINERAEMIYLFTHSR